MQKLEMELDSRVKKITFISKIFPGHSWKYFPATFTPESIRTTKEHFNKYIQRINSIVKYRLDGKQLDENINMPSYDGVIIIPGLKRSGNPDETVILEIDV